MGHNDYPHVTMADVDLAMKQSRRTEPKRSAMNSKSSAGDSGGSPPADQGPALDGSDLPWGNPIPLEDGPPPPVFPTDAIIAEPARQFVDAVAVSCAAPVDMAALGWLALAGGCVSYAGRGTRILRAGPDWIETTNLYAAIALPSGNRKSATFAALSLPIQDFERDLIAEARPDVARRTSSRRIKEAALRKMETRAVDGTDPTLWEQARTLAAELATDPEPVLPRLICDDTSPEKLTSMICQQGGPMILASAECDIIGVLKGRYSDKGGTNLSVFLKAHNGEPLTVDRVGRPSERCDHPVLTMLVCCQPGALGGMIRDPVLADRGVTSRYLYAVPLSPLGSRPLRPPPVPPEVRERYHAMMTRALMWKPPQPPRFDEPTLAGGSGGLGAWNPRWIELDAGAAAALDGLARQVEDTMRPGGDFARLGGWAGKLPGAAVRIAGIMALMDDPDRIGIDGRYMTAGIEIARWSMTHALRAFGMVGLDPDLERARLLLSWLNRRQHVTFSKRDAFQALKGRDHVLIRKATDVDCATVVLKDHGWIIPLDEFERTTGRPGNNQSPVYAVHPSIWERRD